MTTEVKKSEYGYFELVERPTPDALKAYYAEKYYQDAEGSYEVAYSDAEKVYFRNKIVQKLLAATRYISLPADRPPRFLDVGAGEGWALAYFQELGWECVGLDYSSFGCASQNPAVQEHLIAGDIYESLRGLVSSGQHFDLILLDNVLEHVLDPSELLVELRGLLEQHIGRRIFQQHAAAQVFLNLVDMVADQIQRLGGIGQGQQVVQIFIAMARPCQMLGKAFGLIAVDQRAHFRAAPRVGAAAVTVAGCGAGGQRQEGKGEKAAAGQGHAGFRSLVCRPLDRAGRGCAEVSSDPRRQALAGSAGRAGRRRSAET